MANNGLRWRGRHLDCGDAWYTTKGEGERGPYTGQDLKRSVEDGSLTRKSLVRSAGSGQWVPLGDVLNTLGGLIAVGVWRLVQGLAR